MFISDWEHEKNALLLEDLQELKAEVASLNSSYDQCKKTKDTYLAKWSDESIENHKLILELKEQLAGCEEHASYWFDQWGELNEERKELQEAYEGVKKTVARLSNRINK
tara:strand:+ start:441 stop:767 length:327 start_codon:yes stop_codon:yes gene_type:complete